MLRSSSSEKGSSRRRAVRPARDWSIRSGQQELPAARQHEEAVPAVLVDEHLQPGKQRRDALDLVENHAARPRRDEPLRVLLGELPVVRRFQIDVGEVGQDRPAERRLARLPRAGDRDERVPAEQILEQRRNHAGDHGCDCRV